MLIALDYNRLQPQDVRAAAGFMATAREARADGSADGADSSADSGAPLAAGQRPGPRERRDVLAAAVRSLDGVEERLGISSDSPPGGSMPAGAIRPALATAWTLLGQAASTTAEATTRRALQQRAMRLVQSESPFVTQLATQSGRYEKRTP